MNGHHRLKFKKKKLIASIITKKVMRNILVLFFGFLFFGPLINIEAVPGSLSVQVGLVPNNFIVILYFEKGEVPKVGIMPF